MALSEYAVEKLSFKGIQRTTDLRKITEKINLVNPTTDNDDLTLININSSTRLEMTLKNDGQRTIRPFEILTEIFQIPDELLRAAEVLKLKRL
jgi:hypothetical protein